MTDTVSPIVSPIVPIDWQNNLLLSDKASDRLDANIALGESFLPSIKLMQSTSPELTKGSQPGELFLTVKDRRFKKLLICVLATREHALVIENGRKIKESYNSESPIYRDIEHTVPKGAEVQVLYGPEFLCWLPEENEWGLLFPAKDKLRVVSKEILIHMKPKDKRRESDLNREHTNCFIINGVLKPAGPIKKSYVFQLLAQSPDKSYFPEQSQLDGILPKFIGPVQNEPKIEVATSSVDR